MKFYHVQVFKLGAYIKHPNVGHKNYHNAGYNSDLTECIWIAEDNVAMNASGVIEITQTEAETYLTQWQAEKDSSVPQ